MSFHFNDAVPLGVNDVNATGSQPFTPFASALPAVRCRCLTWAITSVHTHRIRSTVAVTPARRHFTPKETQ